MPDQCAQWSEVLVELRGRMDRHTYAKLLGGSFVVGSCQPSTDSHLLWHVAVYDPSGPTWLERYREQVADTARRVAGHPVQVVFQVAGPPEPDVEGTALLGRTARRVDLPPWSSSPTPLPASPPNLAAASTPTASRTPRAGCGSTG